MPLTQAHRVRKLDAYWNGLTTFYAILLNGGTYAEDDTVEDIIGNELNVAEGYSRQVFNPGNAGWSSANNRAELPTVTLTFNNTGGLSLSYDAVAIIGGSVATANATVNSIASDTLTLSSAAVANGTKAYLTSTDTYPTGITAGNPYYVRDASGTTCKLAATSGGSAISIGTSWSGTLTIRYVGSATFEGYVVNSEGGTIAPGSSASIPVNLNEA